ncbi:hypothetical protein FE392_18565 [Xenorhabdus sp. 12]|uniref:Uncharacterized protein n=1 Tax=Xenorhabdus santafensis TaxID=2582833 RepID=A0ABU4SEW9_9GAMM|nr:hypothetical protein [Xenorhabdus sp. 12]MDX7989281.1 hypothetical protein [Xenorhabdus sp. 12]
MMIFSHFSYSINEKIELIEVLGLKLSQSNGMGTIEACKKWDLSTGDIYNIFKISNKYEYNPHREFDYAPCNMEGRVSFNGKIWDFYINGGGITTLENNNDTIYLGCNSKKCDHFFIFPFDDTNS